MGTPWEEWTVSNLNKRLADLDADYQKKRSELLQEDAILSALPSWAAERKPHLHFYPLYGKDCSVAWQHDFYRYDPTNSKPPQPDLALALRLAEALPSRPLTMVRDSCLSFQSAAHVAALPEEKKAHWQAETAIAPFLARVSGYQQRTVEFSWLTPLAGLVCEVKVKLPLPQKLGSLDIVIRDVKGGRRVERCQFRPGNAIIDLQRDGETLAQVQTPIKWASGTADVPNDFNLYWINLREDKTAEPADLFRALLAE